MCFLETVKQGVATVRRKDQVVDCQGCENCGLDNEMLQGWWSLVPNKWMVRYLGTVESLPT
jgi:hypothetical protein